jgi:hypothetical protein
MGVLGSPLGSWENTNRGSDGFCIPGRVEREDVQVMGILVNVGRDDDRIT